MWHFLVLCYCFGRDFRGLFLESPEKPFVKLRPAYCAKLVFSYVVKGIKITAKFCASRCLRFEDTKRIMAPEIRPKSFGTFEKQAPGLFGDHWVSVSFEGAMPLHIRVVLLSSVYRAFFMYCSLHVLGSPPLFPPLFFFNNLHIVRWLLGWWLGQGFYVGWG